MWSAPVRASENHVAPEPIVTLSITTPARERFHPLSIGAHWLTALLLVAVHALIELRGIYPKGSAGRELMKTWHEMLGLAVFAIVFARLALRAIYPAPAYPAASASLAGVGGQDHAHGPLRLPGLHAAAGLAGRQCQGQASSVRRSTLASLRHARRHAAAHAAGR